VLSFAVVQVPFQSFAIKPLTGTHVCITNFAAAERAEIQQQAEAAGANFSAELHKDRCTHLICKTAAGAKYK
jgi:NAD-dependent DNA ligase